MSEYYNCTICRSFPCRCGAGTGVEVKFTEIHSCNGKVIEDLQKQLSLERERSKVLVEGLEKIADALPPNALSMVAGKTLEKYEEMGK